MTVRCEVCGQLPLQGSPRSFFPWPTDSSQRTYWQTCLGLQVVDLNKSDLFICSDHFDSMQMIRKGTALRKDAFPKRYMGPLPIFAPEDESPKIETLLDTTAVKNEDGIFGGAGPSAPIFDDEEIMPEELSMAKLVQMFAAAAKERPPTIVPLVTPIAEETKAFSNILIDRQEKYLNSYCKSCLRQAELVNMLEANCEGVPVSLMYKTVFMSEINGTEVPQMMCATCIGLLFQCFKFSTMTVRSCEVLQAARERFKYLPAIDDGTIDLKNIPQKYSAKSSAIQPVIQSDGEDTKEDITVAKKRKSVVKAKEVPEKKGRRTSSRKASEKAKKVSKKILEESEDEESNDIFDNDDADPDFDTAAYEVKDESPEVSEAEEDNKEGDNTEEDPEDNYCMLCRHSFSNMVRHMDKVHRVDWESKSCERCNWSCTTTKTLFKHCKTEDHIVTNNTLSNKKDSKHKEPKKKSKFLKFSCNKCKTKPASFKTIFEHLQDFHKDATYCIFCNEIFDSDIHMLDHLKTHGKGMYCREHFVAFENYQELLGHVQSPGHDLQCGICHSTFKSRYARDIHRVTHFKATSEPARKGEFRCSQCPIVYNYVGSLKRHVKTFHQKRVFLCEDCGASFTTNFILRRHVAKVHQKGIWPDSSGPNHCCEYCGKIFSAKQVLVKHRVKHLEQGEFCRYCYEAFESSEELKMHVEALKHHLFQCSTCKATFKVKEAYTKHLTKHSDFNRHSKEGTKKQRRPRTFRKQIVRKYPYKIVNGKKQYECQICQKISPSISNFARHLEIHSGVKKYTCEKCGKAFAQYVGLKAHFSVHSNDRPFKCQSCGNCYKDLRNLIKHRRIHEKSSLMDYNSANFVPKRKKGQRRKPAESASENHETPASQDFGESAVNNTEKMVFVGHFLSPHGVGNDREDLV